ncbi:MAG: hypothetical protein RLZZ324_96, partial [Candidatus Parcubacteria bacterium]
MGILSARDVPSLVFLHAEIRAAARPSYAVLLARFFKTGPGQYGEGDVFLGLDMPTCRRIAGKYRGLRLADIRRALASKFHEERLIGLLLLVDRFTHGNASTRKETFDFYLSHADSANNWDLVDLSAPYIVGMHVALGGARASVLTKLARSKSLWRKRIAIVATLALIKDGRLKETFRIADILMRDEHDLIHKAVGWMLREAGKKDHAALVRYLAPRYKTMPRTMLRYA